MSSTSISVPASGSGISRVSLLFGFLLVGMTGYFLYWALGYTQNNYVLLLVLATVFGIFMAFNIGGNDVANSFGTSVGAGTLTIKQALIVAAIFEVSGAVIAGGEVTKTIRKGIVDLSTIAVEPMQFVFIMMSALLAAALWLLIATRRGWPVSTTHSIIGGIVGSSLALGFLIGGSETSLALVKWDKIGQIAISWVLSPMLGGIAAYLLFYQIKTHVLCYTEAAEQADGSMEQRKNEIQASRALENWVPMIAALGGVIIAAMMLYKGLKHVDLGLSTLHNYLIIGMVGAVIWMATFLFAKTLKGKNLNKSTFQMFSWMQVFTASGFAFSHGANDIANAVGPFAAVLDVLRTGSMNSTAAVPTIAMITFGIALVAGLWFIGKEVIQTVGHNLTKMHPSSGFSAELSAALVVMMASLMGLPVSSTHILIGAVLGVGLVNRNANWELMKPIGLAWVVTLPAAGILAAITFIVLRNIF